jgi:hypothetical protein
MLELTDARHGRSVTALPNMEVGDAVSRAAGLATAVAKA